MQQTKTLPCFKDTKTLLKDNYLVSAKLKGIFEKLKTMIIYDDFSVKTSLNNQRLLLYINDLIHYINMSALSLLYIDDYFTIEAIKQIIDNE